MHAPALPSQASTPVVGAPAGRDKQADICAGLVANPRSDVSVFVPQDPWHVDIGGCMAGAPVVEPILSDERRHKRRRADS
jgi:hypothetical protein